MGEGGGKVTSGLGLKVRAEPRGGCCRKGHSTLNTGGRLGKWRWILAPSTSWNAVLDGPGKNSSPTGKCQAKAQVTPDIWGGRGRWEYNFFFLSFFFSKYKPLTPCKEWTRKAKVRRKKDLSGSSVINQMRDDKELTAGPGIAEVKERTHTRLWQDSVNN